MKKIFNILSFIVIFTVTYSCSTKKNAFLNRNYHALTSKYNTLFNGQQAYEKGLKQIREKHKDNFWERLQIEPVTFNDEKVNAESPFEKAEEKAVKAIQKHSMEISGYERNVMIGDAYLLLGKARYYTQRFIPSMEAFNYIITNYSDKQINYETRIWRAKANIRLGNEKIAIQTMKLLLEVLNENEDIPLIVQEQAHTNLAIAYTQTDSIQKVIKHLTKATETFIDKEQSARNMFVLGQIYSELGYKDSARVVFKKLLNARKAPEKYRINANVELVKNIGKDSVSELDGLVKNLKKLTKNYYYHKYFDKLYYSLGVLEEKKGNTNDAIKNYKKSLNGENGDEYQKTYTYERLGDIYFDKGEYLLSSSYYDSVLNVVPKKYKTSKRIRGIKVKNKGLVSLKKYENIVKNNDSILRIVRMPKKEQEDFFNNYIQKIKEEDENRIQLLANSNVFGTDFKIGGSLGSKFNKGKWYFYNNKNKTFGKSEFKRIWGNRKLEDNWRLFNNNSVVSQNSDDNLVVNKVKGGNKYELSTYINAIPTDAKEIEKVEENRNEALYQLGLLYKQQFKDTKLAVKNFERLNNITQDKSLKLPTNYHLYQIYSDVGDLEKANISKKIILENYPNSKFAYIIKSQKDKLNIPEIEDKETKEYEKLYFLYKQAKYNEVVNRINTLIKTVDNSKIAPKLALLRALSIGKFKSKEEYKKVLEEVVVNYSDKEEGKKAKQIIKLLK
ncbi:MAG: tetratricopeptide repeat protein [Tenacibaculum sp.]|nr:tetratricopeptide repeat protein [Tenacibaculum sp.]